MQAMLIKGELMDKWNEANVFQYVNGLLSCENCLKLQKWEYPPMDLATADELSIKLRKNNENVSLQKYYCKVRISKSGNIYVYREIAQ